LADKHAYVIKNFEGWCVDESDGDEDNCAGMGRREDETDGDGLVVGMRWRQAENACPMQLSNTQYRSL